MGIRKLIDDVRQRGYVRLKPDNSVLYAAREMETRGHSAALVIVGNENVGIVSTNDITFKVVAKGRSTERTVIREIMASPVHELEVSPNTLLEECLAIMAEKKVRHLPFLEDGELIGIVNILMVAQYKHNEEISRAMEVSASMNLAT